MVECSPIEFGQAFELSISDPNPYPLIGTTQPLPYVNFGDEACCGHIPEVNFRGIECSIIA